MENDQLVYIKEDELIKLIEKKFLDVGLNSEDALEAAKHLTYADAYGVATHEAVRVRYYCNRIKNKGTKANPHFEFKQTGPTTGIFEGDNGMGFSAVKNGMLEAIRMAKENGTGIVGIRNVEHAGTMSYYLRLAAQENLVAFAMGQSDPNVLHYGSREPYFGTNPFGFIAPQKNGEPVILDMATSVQAWGTINNAKLMGKTIPSGSAVDEDGNDTTNPKKAKWLLPMSGPKGSGLMMMIDILAGSMLGLDFGKQVTFSNQDNKSDYGRNLGMFVMVINPEYFGNAAFLDNVSQMIEEMHQLKPADGFDSVIVPGESSYLQYLESKKNGIPIMKKVYEYLTS